MSERKQAESPHKRKFKDELMQISEALKKRGFPEYKIAEDYLGIGASYFSSIKSGREELDPSETLPKLILSLHKEILLQKDQSEGKFSIQISEETQNVLQKYAAEADVSREEFAERCLQDYGRDTRDYILQLKSKFRRQGVARPPGDTE